MSAVKKTEQLYIYHLLSVVDPNSNELRFKFTCKGGKSFNSCQNICNNDFFIECSKTQNDLLINCEFSFLDILQPANWFKERFGIVVKPFYNIEEISLQEYDRKEYEDSSKKIRIFFEESNNQFKYASIYTDQPFFVDISLSHFMDFQTVLHNPNYHELFDYYYSDIWWNTYFYFNIVKPQALYEKKSRKRGPRGELANLMDAFIKIDHRKKRLL